MRNTVLATLGVLVTACTPLPPPAVAPAAPAVTIQRDDWGVPHVFAPTEELGYYGLGHAQAEDQLSMLLAGVYWAQGRRSELEGAAYLAHDIEQRRWRHAVEAQAGLERLSPQLRRNYTWFAEGVRRFMEDHPEKVPAWAPDLTAADFVAISRMVFWGAYAGVEGPRECTARGVELQASAAQLAGSTERGASNGWVIAPARTADDVTILLADPHAEMQSPAYYEFHMQAGRLHSTGFALGPLLWQVHNERVSWAMTTGSPDMWDCYEVEVSPENPRRYLFDGEWKEMVIEEESIEIAGGEPVEHVFEYTRHNGVLSPVVARNGDKAYVVSTSQMHDAGLLDEEIYRMNHASSVPELRQAMQLLGMFPQNLVMGDSSGNIFYVRAGKTPIRPPGYDWTAPVPGNSSSTAWRGFHTFDDLIQLLNPPQGYIQNNNVAPDRLMAEGNLKASDYPPYLFNDVPGRITTRGLRSVEVLSAASSFSVEDAWDHAFDERWITTPTWQRALRFAAEHHPELLAAMPGRTRDLVDRILAFDGFADADSVAALDFYYWRRGMWEVFSRPEFHQLQNLPWLESAFTSAFCEALLETADRAAEAMMAELGSVDVPLGDVFRIGRGARSWPLGGETIVMKEMPACVAAISPMCDRTIRAFASGSPDEDGRRRAVRGSNSMRLVILSEPVRSYSLHIYGQSNDPDSPHFDDQARLASERRFKPTYFGPGELEGHIEATSVLELAR